MAFEINLNSTGARSARTKHLFITYLVKAGPTKGKEAARVLVFSKEITHHPDSNRDA